jgi:hypothetical protein
MKSVSSVSSLAYQQYQSVSLRIIALKREFLNSFVSVIWQRINRIIFTCVCKSLNLAFFKDNKNNKAPRTQVPGGCGKFVITTPGVYASPGVWPPNRGLGAGRI